MDIHEYQAKDLLKRFGVSTCPAAASPTAPNRRSTAAQRAVGRQAGSSRRRSIRAPAARRAACVSVPNEQEVADAAQWMLGRRLVTHQTGPQGKLVNRLYVEEATNIAQEIYLGFVMDRKLERVVVVASARAAWRSRRSRNKSPSRSSARLSIRPSGMQAFQAREIAFSARAGSRR